MWRRRVSVACFLISALLLAICGALVRPADLVQFVFGGVGPPLLHVQLWILVGAVGLVVAGFVLGPGHQPRHRALASALGGIALCVAALIAWRELRAYSRETVRLPAGKNVLAGTLYVPRGSSAPRSAILIVHGSGPVGRAAYHLFADRLARAGHVVLNVDKRGVGGSSGTYSGDDIGGGSSLEARSVDAAAALTFLRSDRRVDSIAVGVFAISQGSWVLPRLVQRDSAVRFAVVMSGPAVSSGEEEEFSKLTDEDADHFARKPSSLVAIRAGRVGHDPSMALSPALTTPTRTARASQTMTAILLRRDENGSRRACRRAYDERCASCDSGRCNQRARPRC